jgi:hypothetical protein
MKDDRRPPSSFSDFLSPTTSDEGPVKSEDIPRQRYKRRREIRPLRKRRRKERAS